MGARSLILLAVAACGGSVATTPSVASMPKADLRDKVVADFEAAVKQSRDAYVALFDFAAVGEYEILLHRYDLLGRLKNLTDQEREQFFAEDGTPYPEARERRNVGNFYKILAQRTVGTGGCKAGEPRTHYGKLLGTFDRLPDTTEANVVNALRSQPTPRGYYTLRNHVLHWLAKGGVVGFTCSGGTGGIAVVYTEAQNARGYDLITIYDD
jgi:hypothetical protein